MVMRRHRHQFEWLVEGPSDWLDYPGGWIETRYAAKARREGPPAAPVSVPSIAYAPFAGRCATLDGGS